MKTRRTPIVTLFFTLLATASVAQSKYEYVHFDKLIELRGTEFVIATIENRGKMSESNNEHLLFINTKDGQETPIYFPADAHIQNVEHVKIDSLKINKVIVLARTVNLNNDKTIDWNDPSQIFTLSTDGQQKDQLTEDRLFIRTWTINRQTGKIIIAGHYDSNQNGKYDKTDKSEILIYDLKTLELTANI